MALAPTMFDDMKERIHQASTEITPQMLPEVRRPFISELRAGGVWQGELASFEFRHCYLQVITSI